MNEWWFGKYQCTLCGASQGLSYYSSLISNVPDQARQHACPVPSWIHSFHELGKLTPWEYQKQVSAYCYPCYMLSSHCYQSSLLFGSSVN